MYMSGVHRGTKMHTYVMGTSMYGSNTGACSGVTVVCMVVTHVGHFGAIFP